MDKILESIKNDIKYHESMMWKFDQDSSNYAFHNGCFHVLTTYRWQIEAIVQHAYPKAE